MSEQLYGALPEDWQLLERMGLAQDLLPVVSNPNANIWPGSTIKEIGKTPSLYIVQNKKLYMVGFKGWTTHQTLPEEIVEWSGIKDYGACVQTRYLRALDIDVDDIEKVEKIIEMVGEFAPLRYRGNSGKCLFAFIIEGEMSKRRMSVDGGAIEFLGNGQQFIAYGTHPSGERYLWEWYDYEEFPVLTKEEFEELWSLLTDNLAIGEVTIGRLPIKQKPDLDIHDPIVDQLVTIGTGPKGQLHIECPFKDGHSKDSGISETSYFPAGVGGNPRGHFHCFHDSCRQYSQNDFKEALGLELCTFAPLPSNDTNDRVELPTLIRDKYNAPYATVANVLAILRNPNLCGWYIAKDTFKADVVLKKVTSEDSVWRQLEDVDYVMLREHFETCFGFKPISQSMMRECLHSVASENKFDSAEKWINGLQWDGIHRIGQFYVDYMGVEDTPYAQAVGFYTWTAMAGRVLAPGVKADMSPILVGKQGIQKSTGVEVMSPAPELFVEINMAEKEDDRVRRTKGRLVAEFGEMRGMYADRLEHLKAYLSRTHDVWIPKYMEQSSSYARRVFFIGTSNNVEILNDTTGNRRWLPMDVTFIDREGIIAIREQLWAEGAESFKENGVMWQDAEKLAAGRHEKYLAVDPWKEAIKVWLDDDGTWGGRTFLERGELTTNDILKWALSMDMKQANTVDTRRVGGIMRELEYEAKKTRRKGSQPTFWRKTVE